MVTRKSLKVFGTGLAMLGVSTPLYQRYSTRKHGVDSFGFLGEVIGHERINEKYKFIRFRGKDVWNEGEERSIVKVNIADSGNVFRPYSAIYLGPRNEIGVLVKEVENGYFSSLLTRIGAGSRLYFFKFEPVLTFTTLNQVILLRNRVNKQQSLIPRRLVAICQGSAVAPCIQAVEASQKVRNEENCNLTTEIYLFEKKSIGESIKVWAQKHFSMDKEIRLETSRTNLHRVVKELNTNEDVVIVSGSDNFISELCGPGHEDGKLGEQPDLGGLLQYRGFRNNQVFRI
eukprot:maker-scaffold_13-snap-gene-10.4-mRNA-1 protein AED:0.36 eAED:0.36 QI:29/1/1/1/1/1/2/24/286